MSTDSDSQLEIVFDEWNDIMKGASSDPYRNHNGLYIIPDEEEDWELALITCTCDSREIFIRGCKCGAFEREQNIKKERSE